MTQEELKQMLNLIVSKCDNLINNNLYTADDFTQCNVEDIAKMCNLALDGKFGELPSLPSNIDKVAIDAAKIDLEKEATSFCFDHGINITPRQAKEFATHYLMLGHNEGYIKGRKDAHIPAKQLGLPSSLDKKSEVDLEKEIIRYQQEDMDRDTTVADVAHHFYKLGKKARKEE